MGAPSQTKAQMASEAIDMDPFTLAEEQAAGGWTNKDKPVGGDPARADWPFDND